MNPRDFHFTLAKIWQAFAFSKFRIFGSLKNVYLFSNTFSY